MEYIDKSRFLNREQEIDRNFLKDCYDEDSQSFYPEIDSDQSYSNFSSRIYRKGIDGWEHLTPVRDKKLFIKKLVVS